MLTNEKAAAKVLIVDEDSPDNRSTQTIKRNYGHNVLKFIRPYQWIEKSIRRGVCAELDRTGFVKPPPLPFTRC